MSDLVATLPFSGFYESKWSAGIDSELEQWCEYEEEYRQAEEGIPPELRLDAETLGGFAWEFVDYRAAQEHVARDYVDGFSSMLSAEAGFDVDLRFESMSSPRFYNFETDRVFAYVSEDVARRLFAISREEDHVTLQRKIRERFTSRDGFMSYYSADLEDWPEWIQDWDHNQLGTLLEAVMDMRGDAEEAEWSIYYDMEFYSAFDAAMDWARLEERIAQERQELEDEERERNPDFDPPYRCTLTPDLFARV